MSTLNISATSYAESVEGSAEMTMATVKISPAIQFTQCVTVT
jgi:hypothetical protein